MTEKSGWQSATARIRCDEQGRFPSHIGPVSLNQISVSRVTVRPGETTKRAVIIQETRCSMSMYGQNSFLESTPEEVCWYTMCEI